MWKKILSILLMLCMVLTTFPANALTEELEEPNQTVSDNESLLKEGGDNFFAGGNGTEENPFQIANAEQLDAMRNNLSAHYELISNIDLSSFQSWTPIGTADSPFAGTLNGNGYKIGGLTIDEKSIDAWVAANTGDIQQVSLGLFGEVDYNFKCSNISFENYSVNIGESLYPICCGAVVGRIFDKTKIVVSGITVSGTVEILNKKDYGVTVGGIIGNANLCSIDIYDCVNNADIWANGSSAICAGIVGYINNATIKTSDNTGTIIGISQGSTGTVGGIAGFATYSSILECNNRGNVESTVSKFNVYLSDGMNCMVGGIAGETGTTIKDCDNYGDVTAIMLVGGSSAAGGICGYQSNYSTGNTENCTNYGGRITATYGVLVDKDKDIWENRDGFAGRVCGAGINLSNNFSIDSALVNGKFPTDHIGVSEINGASISTGPDDTNTFTEVHQLKSWDVFTNTVYFHDGTSYLRVSEDAVDLDSLLNYWVTCTLRNSDTGVLLVSMEKLEAKTETVIKTLKAYDVITNTVYFTDDTSYPLGENVSIDLDSLLNARVTCTIESNPVKGIYLSSITKYDEDNISWSFEKGTLTIKGTGPMMDYEISPFNSYKGEIRTVVIEPGITRVGNNAISYCKNLKSIYFRGAPPEFGASAFVGLLAVAVYPTDNKLWTPNVMQDYGGQITWQPEMPEGPRITRLDTWHFENLKTEIPRSLYDEFLEFNYGVAESVALWTYREWLLDHYYNDGTAGNCFGMNAGIVTSYFNRPPVSSYGSEYSTLFDVLPEDKSFLTELTACQLIQYGQMLQTTYAVSFERAQVSNNLQSLYDAVSSYTNENGLPITIGISKEINGKTAGHALLALSLVDFPDYSIIGVYDSNFPNVIRPLYLYKSNGRFTSWEYQFSYGDKWGSNEKKANISICKLDDKLYRTLVEKEVIDPDHPTLVLTDSRIFNIASEGENVTATGHDSSNPEIITPIMYSATNMSGSDSIEKEKYLYWVNMGDKLQFANVDPGAEVYVAAGDNGVAIQSTASTISTVTVSADYARKEVLIENTEQNADNIVTIKYYGNSGDDELKTVEIEATTDSTVASSSADGQIDITGVKSITIQTENDTVNLSELNEEHSYQILIGDEEKISSIKADTTGDSVFDDVVYPQEPSGIYVITFNSNGGNTSPATTTTAQNGRLPTLPTATRSNHTFTGWYTSPTSGEQITTDTMFSSDTTVYAHWIYSGNDDNRPTDSDWIPSGNNSSPSVFSIKSPFVSHGIVAISPTSATKGSTVTITATPNAGYELATLTVADSKGNALGLTDKGNGKYTFTMPGSAVTVAARFEPAEQMPEFAPESNPNWVNPYTDVSATAWYYNPVRFVSESSLMNGVTATQFAPDANLSRAQLAQILYNKEGTPAVSGGSPFADVAADTWYTNAVAWASAEGIVGGYSDGRFGPNDNITREQLAVMLWRHAEEPVASVELTFSDTSQISSFARPAICWAVENGILNGKGGNILDPKGFATRAEIAQMLKNYLDK